MTIIKRYTSLAALVDMLQCKCMTFLDPGVGWKDKNDVELLRLYQQKKKLGSVLAICFTEAPETYHHWQIYASGDSGVCIEFDKELLLAELLKAAPKTTAKSVSYLRMRDVAEQTIRADDLPFIKRIGYQDEKEFRLILTAKEVMTSRPVHVPKLLDTIKEIRLSPSLPHELRMATVLMLNEFFGERNISVNHSKLIGYDGWIAAVKKRLRVAAVK